MEAVEAVNLTPSPSPEGVSGDELSDSSLNLSSSFINAENYITIKEGCQSAFTIDELSEAITRCKKLVLESEQCSDERKWFVRRLIELRHRLEQAKENENAKPTSEIEDTLVRLGHNFKLQPPPTPSTKKVYCDYCCGSIWNVVQSYYRCIDCRYKCHDKCSQLFHRVCPILMLSEVPKYEDRINPEEGLDKQFYRCEECQARISFTLSKGYLGNPFSSANSLMEARKCDYNGKYYCRNCHWGTLTVIPARIMKNWEFEPHMVSRASYQMIKMARRRPIISLDPRIYSKIDDLRVIKGLNVLACRTTQALGLFSGVVAIRTGPGAFFFAIFPKKMREELLHMKHYIATCRVALETGFLKELEWGNSLIHSTEMFTLEDLIAVKNGTFLPQIEAIHERLRNHIKSTCEVCKGRGFLCSYCLADDVIYPFDAETAICPECNSVRHKHCAYKSPDCPKCLRKKKSSEQQ